MRRLDAGTGTPLKLAPAQLTSLRLWLRSEHQKALEARAPLESSRKLALRQYNGIPRVGERNSPFENAPNTEITIGALACDAIFAQAMDLIYQVRPIVTVRSRRPEFDKPAEAIQKYLDWGTNRAFHLRPAVETGTINCVQLGTMVYYIPWVETIHKTDLFTISDRGPLVQAIPPEDFILPKFCNGDIQTAKFVTMRSVMTRHDLRLRAEYQDWKIKGASPSADALSDVTSLRYKLPGLGDGDDGVTSGQHTFTVMHTWAHFDIDHDGIEEDLEILWDYTTGNIFKCLYPQYDTRPFVLRPYQKRPHVAYGLGVMEMISPFEQEITEIHNARVANMMLANTRLIVAKEEVFNELQIIHPGKVLHATDPETDFKAWEMADVYPSSYQAEAITMALAERRVGVNELSAPARLGGRTPGMTAMSVLQQSNRRFTPAFDNIRTGIAEASLHCLFRLQEQLKKGDAAKDIEADLINVLGEDDAVELVKFLRAKPNHDLEDAIEIELTASSVSVNREADRQNMVMLAQLYEKYVAGVMQLHQLLAQNPNDKPIVDAALSGINKLMAKIIKSFDQVNDVQGFLIPEETAALQQTGLNGLADHIQQLVGSGDNSPQSITQPSPANPPLQ